MDFLLKKRVIDELNEHRVQLEQQKVNGIESTSPKAHEMYDKLITGHIADVKQLIADVEAEPVTG